MGLLGTACVLLGQLVYSQEWPSTRAERTGYQETSHYEDVIRFLQDLEKVGGPVRIQSLGMSTGGRMMPLAIASFPPISSAVEAKRLGRPIVYIQANIHAGEVEGKEASLAILRRLCQLGPKGPLGRLVLLVAPIYNIDGNEKFGPVAINRPEQDGPASVGVRANGQGLDLNRDAIKAEAPETRGLLEHLYNSWDPDVMMDLHTTDGTRHGWELTFAPPMNPNTDRDVLRFTRDFLLPKVRQDLKREFGMLTFDYGNVEKRAGKERAWYTYGQEGRYCTHYVGLRGRIAILSEATTFIPFKDRVVGTDRFVSAIIDYVASHPKQITDLSKRANDRIISWGEHPETAPELGVRFGFASRGKETVLLEHSLPPGSAPPFGRPKSLDNVIVPIYDRFVPIRTAQLPYAYLLSSKQSAAAELLTRHGIAVELLESTWKGEVSRFDVSRRDQSGSTFQGHRLVSVEGRFVKETIEAVRGAFIVRTSQPLGVLAFHMLEPEGQDGVLAWGFTSSPALKIMTPVTGMATRLISQEELKNTSSGE